MNKVISGKSGFVYIFTNPLFPNWVKIGGTDDMWKRLKNYQQYVPEDYEPLAAIVTPDWRKTEKQVRSFFEGKFGQEKKSKEFFCVDPATALNVFRKLAVEFNLVSNLTEYADGVASATYDKGGMRTVVKFPKTAGVKFRAHIKQSSIYMTVRGDEFVVLNGSEFHPMTNGLKTSDSLPIVSIRRDREALENDPTRCKDGKLIVDVPFKSSSRALAVMLGYSAAQGPQYWVDKEGRPLADYLK